MEYFKSGLKSVLGGPVQGGTAPTGAETVERLVDRVQCSTLLEDRRDACRALKSLSRKYRVEVGAQGMDVLCQVLEMDRGDNEIIGYALDTLCNIMSSEVFEGEEVPEACRSSYTSLGEQFTEIFIKQPSNVGLVLGFLEEYDYVVCLPALRLLKSLLINRLRDIQEIILVSPMGVSKLMDLLGDGREVIRNEALLLLCYLTKGNANIQKIVAFENAFDRLFDVMNDEGYADGGIVVEDCLLVMLNLLKNNTSNQNFFKEGSYIQRLSPMFALPADGVDASWSPQKVSNILCMLQVLRTLVMPGNPAQVISSCQKAIKGSGILEKLCNILMASGVPVDVLTETINAVGEVIRGNIASQEYFSTIMAPSNPPLPAIVVLLLSMISEKQPLSFRCAVLYCFQCYLFKNESGQSQLVQTMLPSSAEVGALTPGQLLCSGLFSGDALSTWLSAVALSHALVENPAQKEQLLRVSLATSLNGPHVTLLEQCTVILQQSNCKLQSKLGILMLLATWLAHCPLAVRHILSTPRAIPYLTAQVGATEHQENEEILQGLCAFLMGVCVVFNDDSVHSYTREGMCQLITKRIGLEVFIDKLGNISKQEIYARTAKHPQLHASLASQLLLDHEFCKLFKALEGMVVKAVTPAQNENVNGATELSLTAADSGLLLQYKELIRAQDRELAELRTSLLTSENERKAALAHIEELKATVSQLRDQTRLLSAAANAGLVSTSQNSQWVSTGASGDTGQDLLEKAQQDVQRWQVECERLQSTVQTLQSQLAAQQNTLQADSRAQSREENPTSTNSQSQPSSDELEVLRKDQEDLLVLLVDQDGKIKRLTEMLRTAGLSADLSDEEEVQKLPIADQV